MTRPPIVIVGAGIGGLGAALAFARAGREVTLVERDATTMPDSVDEAFAWNRRGAPQTRHSHGFAARLHQVLAERFPDVLDELRDAGVGEHDLGADLPPQLTSELGGDLKVLASRRSTYEWVLRRVAVASRAVTLMTGVAVDALTADPAAGGEPPHVTGVRLSDGSELAAEAVVASTGHRGDLRGWLAAHDVDIPETLTPTGVTYLTRFYRLRPGRTLGGGVVQATSRKAGVNYMCVAADNGTFSVTLATDSTDSELRRHLLDAGRFEAVRRLLPGIDTVAEPAQAVPITDVQVMGGLINRLRRFVDAQGSPLVTGFHAIGDAHTTTNPLYGRGCSLAMVQAALLADAFEAHPADPVARAEAYEQASAREVEPWYHFAIDGDALRSVDAVEPDDPRFTLRDILRVGVAEPELLPKTLRALTLLDTPDVVASDHRFVATLAALRTEHAAKLAARRAEGYRPALTRDDLLAAR